VIIVPETSFSYNAHFSLSLPSTTIDTFPTFLIGPNGSGKTTLLKDLGWFFQGIASCEGKMARYSP